MNKKLLILFLLIMMGLPCYADGGLPLWTMTTSSYILTPFMGDIVGTYFFWIMFSILFTIIVFVEAAILFTQFSNFKRVLNLSFKANLVSTIAGMSITLFPMFFNMQAMYEGGLSSFVFFGFWNFWDGVGFIIYNILEFILSVIVEIYVIKKAIGTEYEILKIKNTVALANLATYSIPLFISFNMIFFIICEILSKSPVG